MLAPRYQRIVEARRPFLVAHPSSLAHLELEPFGITIPEENRFDPTRLSTLPFINALHALDSFAFGPKDMRMPRWVLFDCGEMPGVVFGFGCKASELPEAARAAYGAPAERDDAFVPLSMWVAIRCADPDVWLGHNLSSANEVLGDARIRGLATLTKGLGIRVTRAKAQIGATQWLSGSVAIHLSFGEMSLLSAWTPAHSHPATFSYRIEIDEEGLGERLTAPASRAAPPPHDVDVDPRDVDALLHLQHEIERGARLTLVGLERARGGEARRAPPTRMYLRTD